MPNLTTLLLTDALEGVTKAWSDEAREAAAAARRAGGAGGGPQKGKVYAEVTSRINTYNDTKQRSDTLSPGHHEVVNETDKGVVLRDSRSGHDHHVDFRTNDDDEPDPDMPIPGIKRVYRA